MPVRASFLIENAGGELPPLKWRHYSNYAVDAVLGNSRTYLLWYSYEDSNVDNEERALAEAQVTETACPGAYVWIKTGEYIHGSADWRFHTYDPHYRRLAVPIIEWQNRQAELDRVEREWRQRAEIRADGMKYYQLA